MGVDAASGTASNAPAPQQDFLVQLNQTPQPNSTGPVNPFGGNGVVELESVPLTPSSNTQRTLPLADIVKKFASGGLNALAPDEFASLVRFTEHVWTKHQQHLPFMPAGQENKAATVLSLVLTLTAELKKVAAGSDKLALYLINHNMTEPDWQKVIADLPKPSVINEPHLARLINANTTPQNNLLGGVTIPHVAAAPPISVAQIAALNAAEIGGTKENPLPISPTLAVKLVNMDRLMDALGPDAFVLGVAGTVGADSIGLGKLLGKDASVSFLFATLTPMDLMKNGKFDPSFKPLDTTMFLSFKTPGAKSATVVTVKPSEMNVELGKPIQAAIPDKLKGAGQLGDKIIKNMGKGGDGVIVFANARVGYTGLSDDPLTASANGGILIRVDGVKKVIKSVKSAVTKVTRTAQAAQAVAAAATAPATAGTSAVAGVGTIALTEAGKYALFKALTEAHYYVGFAWRLQGNTSVDTITEKSLTRETTPYGIDLKGNVTLQTEDGKWVKFNLADLPGAFFGDKVPDLEGDDDEADKK